MQENFLHLLCDVPGNLNINGYDLGIIDNENNFEFDVITKSDKVFVNYTPISNSSDYIPYTVFLNTQGAPTCKNTNVECIPFPNGHSDIIFSPFYLQNVNEQTTILSQNLGKYYVSIINGFDSQVNIFSGANLLLSKKINKLSQAKAELKKDILIIEGVIDTDNYYILLINTTNFGVIYSDIVQSIECTENNITVLKNLKDISHHSCVNSINIMTKEIQKYYVYENNICGTPNSFELYPQDFLECLKVNDENKLKSYFHKQIINTPIQKFKNYFGNFDKIYLNRHEYSMFKLNYTLIGSNIKNYNFIMEDNKIKDIEEVF